MTTSQFPAGVILPPPEIREIVDKTAAFVARNGPHFEERIKENEKGNPKFSFLTQSDPYRPYYCHMLDGYITGEISMDQPSFSKQDEDQKDDTKLDGSKKPVEPTRPQDYEFLLQFPSIPAQDIEIMELTALFVAKNGKQFMEGLSKKEQNNHQFNFLKPHHSLFHVFTRLVDQYTRIINAEESRLQELKLMSGNPFHVMTKIKQRMEYTMYQADKQKKAEEEAEAERIAYATIDWHDFVVVETIDFFTSEENQELPEPMSLADIERIAMTEQIPQVEAEPAKPMEEDDDDEEMDMDDDELPVANKKIKV